MWPRSIRCFIGWKSEVGFWGAGWRKAVNAAAGIIASRPKAGASCPHNSAFGSPLSRPFEALPPPNMPDWKPEILRLIYGLKLDPAREMEIAEELSQHMEDRFDELVSRGSSAEEARRIVLH